MGYRAQKTASLQQAYAADVYAACQTIQQCSNVLTTGLLAIQRQASAVQDRPQVDVRASFVDAVKHFSAQHGPTDSVFVDKEEQFHLRPGVPVCLCNNCHLVPRPQRARTRYSLARHSILMHVYTFVWFVPRAAN